MARHKIFNREPESGIQLDISSLIDVCFLVPNALAGAGIMKVAFDDLVGI